MLMIGFAFRFEGKSSPDKTVKISSFHSYLVQSKVMSHICSKQDSISNKIKECCEKKIPERGECIINSNKDDRPMDLSLREAKFTENENLCEERNADQDIFMAK